MTSDVIGLLKRVIELQHGGEGAYARSVRVHRMAPKPGAWDGVVHIFSLSGNAAANVAYAWAAPIEGSDSSRYFAVLHQGAVRGPTEAVAAAAKAIRAAA